MIVKSRERLLGWEDRVRSLIENRHQTPYKFGEHDCFHLFMSVERAMYGSSLWENRYSVYRNEHDVIANLRSRVRTRDPVIFVDRVYQRVSLNELDLGDMSFRIMGYGLPDVFLFMDGKMHTLVNPKLRVDERRESFPAEAFKRFWRL